MQPLVLACIALALGSPAIAGHQARHSNRLAHALSQIRAMREANYLHGYGLAKGPYFALIETCVASGSKEDFVDMLVDRNPLIRVTGAICLAHVVEREEFLVLTAPLADDESLVILTIGCVSGERTGVNTIVDMLSEGRFLLRGGGRWGPTEVPPSTPPN